MGEKSKVFEKNADIHVKGTIVKEKFMGLAASQARLLSLTSRIHDVEYQAQMIQSAKMQLALQEDEAYRRYNDALDAQTLTFQNLQGNRIAATFNNLCGLGSISNNIATDKSYVFRDGSDRLIVPSDIYEGYKEFGGTDPYQFAMYMLTGKETEELQTIESTFLDKISQKGDDDNIYKNYRKNIETLLMEILKDENAKPLTTLSETDSQYTQSVANQKNTIKSDIWNNGVNALSNYFNNEKIPDSLKDKVESLDKFLQEYKYKVYIRDGKEIYGALGENEEHFDQEKFNYYLRWAKLIEQEVDIEYCTSAGDYGKDIENDAELLNQMLQSGKISIDMVYLGRNGEVSDEPTSAASDSNIAYTAKSSIDSTELKRAEAEYEKTMRDVQRKDKRYDMDLNKLETERTALTTEYDSVKKVIQDNIERTFKIFS